MGEIELVIKIPESIYMAIQNEEYCGIVDNRNYNAIKNGVPLPKGHGDLFDKTEILRFLKCPEYENCDWGNCFDCNKSRCINLNNVNDLVPIIEADKAESEDKECQK